MPTLLESLTQSFSPDLLSRIGSSTGLDTNLVSKGLAVCGPLLTGAMAQRASTPTGLESLTRLIPQDGGAGLSNLGDLIGGKGGASLLSGIFGSGTNAVGKTLDQKLGFKASTLLAIAGPAVMALLSKVRSERQLDSAGVGKFLNDEQQAFTASGGETAQVVNSVLSAGRDAEATRARYTDEEWLKIRLAPMAAAQVVMISAPSGPIGTIKEATSVARAITEARKDAGPTTILGLAFDDELTMPELQTLGGKAAKKEAMLATIKAAVAMVSARSPGDATAYRRFVTSVATRVAEASKEGGFLGIGGTLVSAEEQAAIDEVNGAVAVA